MAEESRAGAGRSTATVLFTDLVASTEIRSRLGEQTAEEVRRQHDRLVSDAVEKHRGRLVKHLGDGFMATFTGASDGVAAAVGIQQSLARHNRSEASVVPLEIRIGVSAGDVTFEEGDCFGTPVIEAARLCAAAAGGQILVNEIVRLLAGSGSDCQFTPVGALDLKGLPSPVSACEVAWEPACEPAVPMPALLTRGGRIFVGRDGELDRLGRLWKEAVAGERRVALLTGEAGIGKTRLALELAGAVREAGGIVLAGRCDDDLGVPYQPFLEALRHYVTHASERRLGRYAGELVRVVPELPELVGGLPEPLRSDPETERYRLFDALAAWLSDVSAEAPVLLVVDDLHWAAKPTLLLLRHVLRSPEPFHLLIVGTYRDSDIGRDHPMSDLLADLRRDGSVERFSLSGLDTPAVAAFIEAAAGHRLDDEEGELPGVVWRETEGNPFFVAEVLRHLSESRAIEERDGRWVLNADVGALGIPEGVRDVVGWRLSRLAGSTNRILATAAVAGLEFEPAVVEGAADVGEETLLAALEEATLARLLVEAPGARYRFAHALVRATLYDELAGARRAALHRRVAEAIESLHGEALDDYLPALAHHWARAAAPGAENARAVEYATRAGDRALAQLAHDEAVRYYRQALEFLEMATAPTDEQRLELLIALGEAQCRAGDTAHRETLLKASHLAAQRGDAEAVARAALANVRGPLSSAVGEVDHGRVAALEVALEMVRGDDSSTRARLLAAQALELLYAGDRERRRRLADDALVIARRAGDAATLAQVLLLRFYTIYFPDALEELLANTDELVALAANLDDPVITARASWVRFRALAESGDLEQADRHLQAAERLAEELGQPTLRWLVGLARPGRTILSGDLEEAEQQALAGFELGKTTGQVDAALFMTLQLFNVRFEQDRLGDLEERLAERLAADSSLLPVFRAYMALALCELDRPDEAIEHYEQLAAGKFTGVAPDTGWILAMPQFAAVCSHLGDAARAGVLFDLLLPYTGHIVVSTGGALGAVTHYLGLLATTFGDFEEAERRFAAAATTHQRIPAPVWLARTQLEWSRMLVARRERGDMERARGLLGRALVTARERGLANIERRAVELMPG